MRHLAWVLAGAMLLLILVPSGCSPTSQSGTESSDNLVRVPDVISAVRSHDFTKDYVEDQKMAAIVLHSYVDGALEASGLESDLVMVPSAATDSQEPEAGSLVKTGTTVTVRIGIDD
ncbi:MAG: PASTA domain-containing protein [Coriobacteriia bacterium]|nr:PASTA domain-containing protein [Coriobacteriia bacterium]